MPSIKSIEDVERTGATLCVQDKYFYTSFLDATYPTLEYKALNVGNALGLTAGLRSGACDAVIGTNVELLWAMSPAQDPAGSMCDFLTVGSLLSFGWDGFAMNPFTNSAAQVDAMNTLMLQASPPCPSRHDPCLRLLLARQRRLQSRTATLCRRRSQAANGSARWCRSTFLRPGLSAPLRKQPSPAAQSRWTWSTLAAFSSSWLAAS